MLTLVVISLDGQPPAADLRGTFGLLGGTIGAMEGTTITLPDAGGRIGPLEANIIAGARGHVIRNCGERPLYVNGRPVENSAEAPVGPGDEITIGPYVLHAAPAEAAAAPGKPAPAQPAMAPSGAAPAAAAAGASPAPQAASAQELERALLDGLGLPNLELPDGLTPELMAILGELLKQVTQGTIDLLRIRAEAKSRVHADLTMISATREINPLKAAWDAQVALQHLLVPQRSDMLDPLKAMTDACDDLRLHDIGLVAGVHAALASLLARFDPATLDKKIGKESKFESLMPGGGKAKRWDLLVELYGDLAVESGQDFWSIFEKDFLKAYESGRAAARGDRF